MAFLQLPKNRVVFNYGDIGMKLYIILEGEVFILVPKDKDKKDKELE